jgi:predicted amidophosphoribosyltransferase
MITWRCPSPEPFCGRCGRLLSPDEPVLELTVRGLSRVLVRCQGCVGEEPPADVQTEREVGGLSKGEVMRRLSEIVPSLRAESWAARSGEQE